jgi:hypothetical protein
MASDPLAWWTRDLRVSSWVFMGFTLLNVFLLCSGFLVSGGKGGVWFWVFAFPVMLAAQHERAQPDWTCAVMVVLNPWLYGLMGWCAWRLLTLMRRKPEADEADE